MASELVKQMKPASQPGRQKSPFFSTEHNHESPLKPRETTSTFFEKAGNKTDPVLKKKENGGNLPDELQAKMENVFDADFFAVKVYENSSEAQDLNAIAYTQGNEIHFAPGYDPFSGQSKEYLGHELAHVVQQKAGVVEPTHQERGHKINDNKALEYQADVASKKIESGQKFRIESALSQNKNHQAAVKKQQVVQKQPAKDPLEAKIMEDIKRLSPQEILLKYELGFGNSTYIPPKLFHKYIAPVRAKVNAELFEQFQRKEREYKTTLVMNERGEVGSREQLDLRKAYRSLTQDLPAMINSGVSGGMTYQILTSFGYSHEEATKMAIAVGGLVNAALMPFSPSKQPEMPVWDQRAVPTLGSGTGKTQTVPSNFRRSPTEIEQAKTLPDISRTKTLPDIGRAKTLPEDIGRAKTLPGDIGRAKTQPDISRAKTQPEDVGRAKTLPGVSSQQAPGQKPLTEEQNQINLKLNVEYVTRRIREHPGWIVDIPTLEIICSEADALYPVYLP
jgi:hypothetical protein